MSSQVTLFAVSSFSFVFLSVSGPDWFEGGAGTKTTVTLEETQLICLTLLKFRISFS